MSNLRAIRTLDQLFQSLQDDPALEQEMKENPSAFLERIKSARLPDTRVYRIVVSSLGAAIIIALIGAIAIVLYWGANTQIPDILVATAAAAIGALAGLLAPQPSFES